MPIRWTFTKTAAITSHARRIAPMRILKTTS
jgi:hypothetical protein